MTVADALAAIVPSAHVKFGPVVHVPCEGVIVPYVKPAGQVSLRLTACASDGPLFATVIV